MKDLKGKVALVTGAASGIGQATSLKFAQEQADLVITDLNEDGLNDTAEQIRALGRKVLPIRTDIARREEVEALCNNALEEFGRVDILMNNAGVALYADIIDTDLADWEWMLGINLWGPIYALHFLLPHMVARKSGHIINIASWMGLLGQPANGAYAASKFGIVGLSESLRAELERFGIGVTVVCPGIVQTNIFKAVKVKGFKPEVTKMPGFIGTTPEGAAMKIVHAVKKDKALVLTDFAKIAYAIRRLSPALARQIGRGGVKVFQKSKL
jgi:NAD(P)-dependent dehydrogenase (short-subunit alcohol dehydrogenase family)